MRESWTDERLDDFREETARRFEQARTETARRFEEAKTETSRRFEEAKTETSRRFDRIEADIREIRGEMNGRFGLVEARLDDLNQTMLKLGSGALITFVVGFVGLIATQL